MLVTHSSTASFRDDLREMNVRQNGCWLAGAWAPEAAQHVELLREGGPLAIAIVVGRCAWGRV